MFLAQEGFVGLRQVPLEARLKFASKLTEVISDRSDLKDLLKKVKAGDLNTYSLELNADYQALFRQFSDDTNEITLVLLGVCHKDGFDEMAKCLRFFWDGETTGLIRVLPKSQNLQGRPFSRFSLQELAAIGVPKNLLEKTQAVETLEDLVNLEGDFQPPVYFRLLEIAEQYLDLQIDDDFKILNEKIPEKELKSLESEISQNLDDSFHSDRFCLIESEDQVKGLLDDQLPKWAFFPLPDQKKWVTRNFKGPVMIRGVSGSGKTSLALLRAKYLAEELLEGNDQWILIITPFRTDRFLNEDMKNLGGTNIDRIEVKNVYDWTKGYLNEIGVPVEYNLGQSLEILKEAIDACRPGMPNITPAHLDFNFVRDEIAMIIKGRVLHSQPDYLSIPRRGFGTPLSSEERRHLWRIYLKYQNLLTSNNLYDAEDLLVSTYKHISKKPPLKKYAAVIIDDTQDLQPVALKIFHTLMGKKSNSLFMLSDVTQKFSRSGDLLTNSGIQLSMRSPLLRTNLRNTREISNSALEVLGTTRFDEMDGSTASQAVHPEVFHRGAAPQIHFHETEEQEILWVMEQIAELTNQAYGFQFGDIALFARSNRYLTLLEVNLNQGEIPCHNYKKLGFDRQSNKVKLLNYSDCKGLEFPVVILTEVVDDVVPTIPPGIDSEELAAHLSREQRLLYCGMSRAKKLLFISGASGVPSRFIESQIPQESVVENSTEIAEGIQPGD